MILSISSIYADDLDESSDIISSMDDSNNFIKNDLSNSHSLDSHSLDSGSLVDGETGPDEPITIGSDYEELANLINNTIEGGILELDKDYKFVNDSEIDSKKGILISKSIVIDGKGHTINANKISRFFNITADNVILRNINFINGNALGRYDRIDAGGGAIYWYGDNGKVLNCNFTNNTGFGIEDDPFDKEEEIITEDGTVIHTIRVRPMGAKTNEGGAIVWKGNNGAVSNCIFKNNDVGYPNSGGAIVWRGDNGKISNSTFFNNSAWCGGAITWVGKNGKILSSKFFENGMFNGDIYWFGENGLIKKCILLKSDEGRSVLAVSGGSLNANYNFWGDSLGNPNGTIKLENLSNWYILNKNSSNPKLFKGDKLLVGFDDFLLVTKYGNVYNNSKKIEKINLNPNAKIVSKNLTKYYKSSKQFKVKVYDAYGKLAKSKYVSFKINNKTYRVKTNKKGIASLKINQKPGKYNVLIRYGKVQAKNKITVKTVLITKNITKKVGKRKYFSIKVLDAKGKPYARQVLKVKFRGKNYKLKTKKNGIARFIASKRLKAGTYKIKVSYKGITNINKIRVKR